MSNLVIVSYSFAHHICGRMILTNLGVSEKKVPPHPWDYHFPYWQIHKNRWSQPAESHQNMLISMTKCVDFMRTGETKWKEKDVKKGTGWFRFSCCMCSLLTLLYFLPSLVTLSLGNSVARCQLNSWSHSMATNSKINFTGQHVHHPRKKPSLALQGSFFALPSSMDTEPCWMPQSKCVTNWGQLTWLNAALVTRCEDQQSVWYQNTRKFSPNPPIQNMNAK
jgi:hypothetical protein